MNILERFRVCLLPPLLLAEDKPVRAQSRCASRFAAPLVALLRAHSFPVPSGDESSPPAARRAKPGRSQGRAAAPSGAERSRVAEPGRGHFTAARVCRAAPSQYRQRGLGRDAGPTASRGGRRAGGVGRQRGEGSGHATLAPANTHKFASQLGKEITQS